MRSENWGGAGRAPGREWSCVLISRERTCLFFLVPWTKCQDVLENSSREGRRKGPQCDGCICFHLFVQQHALGTRSVRGTRQALMRASAHLRSPGARRWDAGTGWKGGSTGALCFPAPSAIHLFRHQGPSTGREEQPGKRLRRGWGGLCLQRGERRDVERNSCSNRREAGLIGANTDV